MSSSLTTAEIADSLGTTTRTLRKFLRSSSSPFESVGQGSRYNIDAGDLPEIKKAFESWVSRPGSRSSSAPSHTADTVKRSPKKPKVKIVEKTSPLDNDSAEMRTKYTIAQRMKIHNMVCQYSFKHPKVKDLNIECYKDKVAGTDYCPMHQQLFYCGDTEPVDNYCGPGGRHPKPYCKYHNAEISEDELEAYLALPIEERDH